MSLGFSGTIAVVAPQLMGLLSMEVARDDYVDINISLEDYCRLCLIFRHALTTLAAVWPGYWHNEEVLSRDKLPLPLGKYALK